MNWVSLIRLIHGRLFIPLEVCSDRHEKDQFCRFHHHPHFPEESASSFTRNWNNSCPQLVGKVGPVYSGWSVRLTSIPWNMVMDCLGNSSRFFSRMKPFQHEISLIMWTQIDVILLSPVVFLCSVSRSSFSESHLPNYLLAEEMGRTGNCTEYLAHCEKSLFKWEQRQSTAMNLNDDKLYGPDNLLKSTFM